MKKAPNYLTNLIPKSCQSFRTRTNRIPTLYCRTDCFKNSFFLSALSDWFQLDVTIRNSESIAIFRSRLLFFVRSIQSDVYNIFDPTGLDEHRFRHSFQDCLNPFVYVVWKLKVQNITFCTAIISPNTVSILSIV